MKKKGLATIEPAHGAEDTWMNVVRGFAQRSLINKAKTWWVGANVKDKPQGLTMFTGGFQKYREYCAASPANGYQDFQFERLREALTA